MNLPRRPRRPLDWGRWKPSEEDRIQYQVVADLKREGWEVVHVPNQRKYKSKAEAHHYAMMGVRKGASDLFIPAPPPAILGGLGAWLELKTETGRASPEQREFLALMAELGYATAVVKGYEAAVAQLQTWGYLPL